MDGSSAAVGVLVQNLIDLFKQEYSLIQGLDAETQQLEKTLRITQAYLNDAEKISIDKDSVKIWLRDLEAFAFDADNVFDEFSYHHLRNKVKKMKAPESKVQSFLSPIKHIARRRSMDLKIKDINKEFESMNKRATALGLQSMIVNASPAVHASFETDSFTADPIFVGRDDDVDKLVDMVVESPHESNPFILAIVGMGGLGKTTLTRKVFNREKMKSRFGSLVWVHVSQTFDPITLLKKILRGFGSQCGEDESRQDVMKKLQEALKDKTYLLVLDDVWNEDVSKWDEFMNSVSGVTSTQGNAIIITTREEGVASKVTPRHVHSLIGLSDQDCWSIIKAKAFENGEAPSSGFEMVGREIAKRCQGLPLAANVVGGVLLGCKFLDEWRFVNESRLSEVEGGEIILEILKLSYHHLASASRKKCFAYCSIFPKGREIVKQEVIEMWMAEGFLQPSGKNDMESVGNEHFNVLVHNSLLLVSKRDDYGNVSSCVMHDLVHDVASSVLGSSNNVDGSTPLRYMVHDSGYGSSPIPKEVAKHLRTLVLEGYISDTMVFRDFKSLHVLTLDTYGVNELPSSIRKLIHLRKLDISSTGIRELPEWIGELHHLQTLRARGLEKLQPSTLEFLTTLSHLSIDFSFMDLPADIGRLTGLQSLKEFKVGDEGYRITELGSLNNLRGKLKICNLEKVDSREEAEKANMFQKQNLSELSFEWSYYRGGEAKYESVLEGLQPHPNINKLWITRFMGKRFPAWTTKMAVRDVSQGSWIPLDKLVELVLWGCGECEDIPMLSNLSSWWD